MIAWLTQVIPHHRVEVMTDPVTRLNAALEGRYRIERQLGEGGMAMVYLADDLKHERKVALKVLKPELAAVVGAERFLAEIKRPPTAACVRTMWVTAGIQPFIRRVVREACEEIEATEVPELPGPLGQGGVTCRPG